MTLLDYIVYYVIPLVILYNLLTLWRDHRGRWKLIIKKDSAASASLSIAVESMATTLQNQTKT